MPYLNDPRVFLEGPWRPIILILSQTGLKPELKILKLLNIKRHHFATIILLHGDNDMNEPIDVRPQ